MSVGCGVFKRVQAGERNLLVINGVFGQKNVPFSFFNDNQSKSFLHLPVFLKIQHIFVMKKIVRNEIMLTVGVTFLVVLVLLLFV